MENQGVLPFSGINKTRDFVKKSIAGEVERSSYVPIVTPFVISLDVFEDLKAIREDIVLTTN